MKNKKGFVFVETIVVCAVLSVSLVMIYASFVMLVSNQKQRNRYDQLLYNYRLYNIAKELSAKEIIGECTDNFMDVSDDNLKGIFKYESLYYVSGNGVKNNPISNKNNLREYLKTIKTSKSNSCILIGEFKNTNLQTHKDEYYYSYVEIENEG